MSEDLLSSDALSNAARRRRAQAVARPKGREWKVLRAADGTAVSISGKGRKFAIQRDEAGRFTGIEEQ